MKTIQKIILILFSVLCFLSSANAAVPHLINYQGRLTNAADTPVADGNYSVAFRIYDAESGGTLLWQGTHTITVSKGIFNVLLGDINDSGYNFANLTFDRQYFLAIKVGSDPEMTPSQRITSAGYAISAEKAEAIIMPGQKGDILYYDGSAWTNLPAGTAGQVLKTQGTGANPIWANSAGGWTNMQVFTSSGTWIRPTGINKVWVKVWGAGGGGGGGSNIIDAGGGGGGAGGYSEGLVAVSGNVTVTVGIGGSDGNPGTNGGNGGNSFFVGDSTLTGNGGSGNGAGGTASGGDENITGGAGDGASIDLGAISIGGGGGVAFLSGSTFNATPGYGSGGSGGHSAGQGFRAAAAGKAGGNGLVIVYWSQ